MEGVITKPTKAQCCRLGAGGGTPGLAALLKETLYSAAEQAASAGGISKASLPAMLSGVVMKEDAQEDGVILPMPPGAFVEKEMVSPMPSDPFVKQEVVVKEEEGPGRSKRQRTTRRRIHAVQGIHTFFRVVELPRRESRTWDFSF